MICILNNIKRDSVLGPLLFVFYTKDLPNCLQYLMCILFADDITVYLKIIQFA